jgi:hypothetical protein
LQPPVWFGATLDSPSISPSNLGRCPRRRYGTGGLSTNRIHLSRNQCPELLAGFLEALRVKVSLVVAILALSLVHDMHLGPRLAASQEGRRDGPPSAGTVRARRNLIWMARVNVLLVVALLAVTVSMTRGNPF